MYQVLAVGFPALHGREHQNRFRISVFTQAVRFSARSSNGKFREEKMAVRGHFFFGGEYFGYILKRVWIGERKYFGG